MSLVMGVGGGGDLVSRRRNPLPEKSDGEVLRMAARLAAQLARRELAARLHAIARRVPLWTRRVA